MFHLNHHYTAWAKDDHVDLVRLSALGWEGKIGQNVCCLRSVNLDQGGSN